MYLYLYYPGAGGSISVTTKPIYYYPQSYVLIDRYQASSALFANVVTSVSGGGGSGSYSYTDSVYLSTVDERSYGKCYGKVRRDLVGGIYNNTATNNGSRSLYCDKIPNTKDALSTTRGCRIEVLSWGGREYKYYY